MNGENHSRRGSREPKLNLVQIQDRFVERVNAAYARWSHSKRLDHQRCGGHYDRSHRGAYREAMRDLLKWGFTPEQARAAIKDASDMADLERNTL
jgi:hypothetical protein